MTGEKPEKILKILEEAGYEAYYVGGCVRDLLLGRPVHDWDVTTSALPEETMACFPHCVPTGLRHGTVTVLEDGARAEVTTFRCDGSYGDGRHPDQVTFVRSLREDLARRDFTVNAMAMDRAGGLTDLYGGQADLEAGILRCVGAPERRFQEDALRMLRAVRFSAQLGFAIEPETWTAMGRCASLCARLSAERVRGELEKTLLSDQPHYAVKMADLGLLDRFGLPKGRDGRWLARLPRARTVRWAGFCRLYPELDLSALRLDKRTTHTAQTAARCAAPGDEVGWKRLAASEGAAVARAAAALAGETALVERLLESGQCLTLRDLAVTGADFPGLTGPAVGNCLRRLLDHVLAHPEDNRREILLALGQSEPQPPCQAAEMF